ncbi:MAG: sarcosine oxidase subunit alpha family protein [Salinarimonas sp.]
MSGIPGQPRRLAEGGLIDRARTIEFRFDGRDYRGHPGDTLASALLAAGVRRFGRSFKYHRLRGVMTAGPEEPNALVTLGEGARREPNTRATTIALHQGLVAESQNRWPSLDVDLLSLNQLIAPFLSAGFYYKTFMWPRAFWERVYEPLIRRAAGLGRAAQAPDPDHYEKAVAHCDLLVIGAGPAGLMAALAAGRTGARVIIVDEDERFGGRLLSEADRLDGLAAPAWVDGIAAELGSLPETRLLPRTTLFGIYDGGVHGAVERVADQRDAAPAHAPRQRMWRIHARRTILATGAIERPMVFSGNDRPGVMLAGAARSYLTRYAVKPAKAPVILTSCDDGWRTLDALVAAKTPPVAIIDSREMIDPALVQAAKSAGIPLHTGARIVAAHGRDLARISIRTASGAEQKLACDGLFVANGWNPNLALTSHLGDRPVYDEAIAAFVPGQTPPGMAVAGAAAGRFSLEQALTDGARLGIEAATECGFAGAQPALPVIEAPGAGAHKPIWQAPLSGKHAKTAFVDQQNDVTAADIALAHREGFRAVEHLKRYTTLGMATDQGKTSNLPGLAIMAELTGRGIAQTGTTMFRPPASPVAIGALAGPHRGNRFRPTRRTPGHDWAQEAGAIFVESGPWLRAQYFPRDGEADWLTSVDREVSAVRAGVGVCDVTTLGKIDVQGRDAAAFLDFVYANLISTLPVGKARYGLMLREDGFIFDDGTVARIAENHFLVSTTTANAARVMQHMELCAQWHRPDDDVRLTSISEAYAQYALAGPRARDVLAAIVDEPDAVSAENLPYLGVRDLTVGGGVPARIFRLSFSGELAYEIAVPAQYGDAAIRAIMAAGETFRITPYGTEALGVMRIEKGHASGPELNGQTTAHDLGLGRMLSKKKDFIGKAMALRPALTAPERPRLVGITPCDPGQRLRAGAHILPTDKPASAAHDQGWVTSVAHSPECGHWIGLALVSHGPERIGETLRAVDLLRGEDIAVRLCDPVFIDKEGARLHG